MVSVRRCPEFQNGAINDQSKTVSMFTEFLGHHGIGSRAWSIALYHCSTICRPGNATCRQEPVNPAWKCKATLVYNPAPRSHGRKREFVLQQIEPPMAGQGRPRASRYHCHVTEPSRPARRPRPALSGEDSTHKPREPAPRFLALPQPTLADARRQFPVDQQIENAKWSSGTIAADGACRHAFLPAFPVCLPSPTQTKRMMVRVAWGGGSEKLWEGSIAVSRGTISQPRPLGIEADEPGSMWLEDGRLLIRQRSPRAYDGVDIIVTAPADAKLIVQLTAAGDPQQRAADRSSPGRHLQRVPQLAARRPRESPAGPPRAGRFAAGPHVASVDGLLSRRDDALRSRSAPLARGRRHPRADQGPVARRPAAAVVVQRAGRARRQRGSRFRWNSPCRKTRAFTTSRSRPSRTPAGRGPCASRCVGSGRSPSGGCNWSSFRGSRPPVKSGRELSPGPRNRPRQFPLVGKGQAAAACRDSPAD